MPTSIFHAISYRPLLALLSLCLAACAEPPVPPLQLAPEPVARFLAEPPTQLLDLDDLYELPETNSWSWRRQVEVDAWTVEALTDDASQTTSPQTTASAAGLEALQPLRLHRDLRLAADTVQRLEVELDPQMAAANLRLLWRRNDEESLPARRHLSASPLGARQASPQRYVFHVAQAAAWRGEITELVLEVRWRGARTPRLQRLVALGRRLDSAQLAKVAGQGVLVELDHEVREAYLAPPGSAITRQLDIAAGDRLRFAYGSEAAVRQEIQFRVVVEPATGVGSSNSSQTSSNTKVLWQDQVGVDGQPWGAWHTAEVDLTAVAGQARLLRLETWVAEDDDTLIGTSNGLDATPTRGFPLWGHPEVLRTAVSRSGTDTNSPSSAPYNLLFISLDTVRADRLSLYGHPKPTSPHLDAFAQAHGVVFEQAVAAAPWTLPSHMTLFSGLDALHHGINHDVGGAQNGQERGFELLAERLRRQGYVNAATTGGAYLHPKYGFSHGFQSYRYWQDRARDDGELTDGIDRTLEFIGQERSQPFFFFLHTYAAHDPYEAHQPYFAQMATAGVEAVPGEIALHSPPNKSELAFQQQIHFELRHGGSKRILDASDRPLLEAFYDSGLARLDAELGRLFDGLEAAGRMDDTVIVITSDHGENLFDAGHRIGHLDLYDSNLLVPLVISWPDGRGAGRRIAQQVRATDVLPTILESLGMTPPPNIDGVSLRPLLDEESMADPQLDDAWSYCGSANRGLALRRPDGKLIVNNNAWRPTHLDATQIVGDNYEFFRRTDAEEADDLWTTNSAPSTEATKWRQQLEAYWQSHGRGLRLTLHHPGPGILEGQLKGPMIRPVGTKAIDLTCHCLTWQEMGQASFRLQAGDSFTVQFEKVFGPKLELSGHLELGSKRHPLRHTFDADQLPTAGLLQWDGERWQTHDTEDAIAPSAPYLRLYWLGARRQAAESPALSDPDLRRQLEALGYL